MASRSHFSTRECSALYGKDVTRLSPHCYYPSLACLIHRFVSNRTHLGSFGMASWVFHEFERTRGKFTAIDEDNVSTAPIQTDKEILEFVQSSKNSIDADSDDGNEMNKADPVPRLPK
ncbi:hypothetical protein TNCV_3389211 [Trichonephila clavipes]|nr:hypothetical protein TNCV_3389211 [Trichonephila clavipes]